MNKTIAVVGYRIESLSEVDNAAICAQVIAEQKRKLEEDPRSTHYEDSNLPDTPEIKTLIGKVDTHIKEIDQRLAPSPNWAHILAPGESTMYHTHAMGNYPSVGLSWVYYASFPADSGGLVFVCRINERTAYHRVEPAVGKLVIFGAGMPHMTTRHCGEGMRVSISGNYFLPRQAMQDFMSGEVPSGVAYFNG